MKEEYELSMLQKWRLEVQKKKKLKELERLNEELFNPFGKKVKK